MRHHVGWVVREPPLSPCAIAGRGDASRALARRLLSASDESLAELRGVGAPDLIVVVGAKESLPWVDGAIYLGKDDRAPALLLPTTRTPSLHPELFERALLRGRDARMRPLAVLLDPPTIAPLGAALPLRRALIESWLKDQERPR